MRRALCFLWLVTLGMLHAQQTDFDQADFQRADSVAALYQGEDLKNLPLLSYKLSSPLTSQVEQFRAIYTWVSTNIESDHNYYLKNKKKRKQLQNDSLGLSNWNKQFRIKVFDRLLNEQRTVCTGYAYLVRELAALAGINCKIIDGYGRTVTANIGESSVPNHSWNAVQLNGKWYLCDATFSSGSYHYSENMFIPDYQDGYFLAEPELFAKSHYPLDTAWILMDEKPDFKSFLEAPLIYKYAFKHQLIPVEPQAMNLELAKHEQLRFLFKAPESLNTDALKLVFVSGTQISTFKPDVGRTQEGLLEISYRLGRTGKFDVHLQFGEEDIVSYVLRVKRRN